MNITVGDVVLILVVCAVIGLIMALVNRSRKKNSDKE
jgi:hypothetical protein